VYDVLTGSPFTFPKYWNIPLISISISLGIAASNISFENMRRKVLTLALPTIGAIFVYVETIRVSNLLKQTKSFSSFGVIILPTLLIFIVILSLYVMLTFSIDWKKSLGLALIFAGIMNNFTVNVALSEQTYSTRYYFGESGEKEVLDWIRQNTEKSDKIMAAKDIGLQSNRHFYEDAYLFAEFTPEKLMNYLAKEDVKYIVVRNLYDYSKQVYGGYFSVLSTKFTVVPQGLIGDFEIWRANG
jgi:hypothetical protein